MKCLIIAAGRGSRLRPRGDSKPLIPVLGVPMIERVIRSALEAGTDDFYVITGCQEERVHAFLDRLSDRLGVAITTIVNEAWEKENGLSVLKAREFLREPFLLLMADHLFDPAIPRKLMALPSSDGEITLAVDGDTHNSTIDMADVTRVKTEGGKILNIGKGLTDFNGFDTGIFLCTPAIFSALVRCVEKYGDGTLSGAVRVLAAEGRAKAVETSGFWIDVDNEEALKKAESRLLSTLKKTSDGPISRYLNRPISLRITRHFLLKTGVTPNLISVFSFLLALLATYFFFLGQYVNLVIGAILTQVSSVIDGCDGEVARLKYKSTDWGGWFDAVLDRYADGFVLFGLTYYVYRTSGNSLLVFIVGFLALMGTFMNSYTADKYDGLMRKKLGPDEHYFRMGRDVRMFIIFLGALANQPFLALVLIALVMNVENIRRVVVLYRNG